MAIYSIHPWNSNFAVPLRQFSSGFHIDEWVWHPVPKTVDWYSGESPALKYKWLGEFLRMRRLSLLAPLRRHCTHGRHLIEARCSKTHRQCQNPMRICAVWSFDAISKSLNF
ncbi:hypothetical protein AVEN_235890-1 [Araneus ventricosus]|uniref:Uncharacterized protein n=1 Tax=Araneus ventricosus TaxID=182803 RepID=A0A4Y2N0D2_ARAVE|nr:hypothetical protein AVEN_235890-1 [Araneus ventricosus]